MAKNIIKTSIYPLVNKIFIIDIIFISFQSEKPSALQSSLRLAKWVYKKLFKKESFTSQELFKEADREFGGTQSAGLYTPKDAYDAMEVGINKYFSKQAALRNNIQSVEAAKKFVSEIKQLINKIIPTQTKRTEETDEFQQFSTPPHLAFAAAWMANISKNDIVLEPSAGVGGLAVWSHVAGAKTIVNELSQRRSELLKIFPFYKRFTENAEQLHNILPKDVRPTVVLMNPPFSSTAGRIPGQRKTMNATIHIEQALKRLEPGGRLVAIVGRGMSMGAPTFKPWWKKIGQEFDIKANIGISGKEYKKYGTSFDNRIIIIDKSPPNNQNNIVEGVVERVEDLFPILERIRNGRATATKQTSNKQDESKSSEESERPAISTSPGSTVLPPANAVGNGHGESSGHDTRWSDKSDSGSDVITVETEVRHTVPTGATGQHGGLVRSPRGQPGTGRPGSGSDRLPKDQHGGEEYALASDEEVSSELQAIETAEILEETSQKAPEELSDSIYEPYYPQKLKIPDAQPHPGKLVQSAAMSVVEPPAPTYTPKISRKIIKSGKLSIAQMEAIVYAGQAHSQILPNGFRRGFFIGDGTGVGKGREIAGIIMDNMNRGRKKAIWISQSADLFKDAKRDMEGIGGDPEKTLFTLAKTKTGEKIKNRAGVLFTTYNTLISDGNKAKKGNERQSRLEQIVEWAGEDFDGVIAFDEAHKMSNDSDVQSLRSAEMRLLGNYIPCIL